MRLVMSTALLMLLAGTPAYPQQPQDQQQDKEKKKPPDQEKPKPPQPQEPPKPKPSDKENQKQKQKQQEQERKEQERSGKQEPKQKPPKDEKNRAAETKANSHGGHRISEAQFHANFGRQHTFRVQHTPDRRFQSGGFVFEVVEVWPTFWNFDDDAFIDDIDGDYYLCDAFHPELRVLIIVVETR